jgi:hypothetical protein
LLVKEGASLTGVRLVYSQPILLSYCSLSRKAPGRDPGGVFHPASHAPKNRLPFRVTRFGSKSGFLFHRGRAYRSRRPRALKEVRAGRAALIALLGACPTFPKWVGACRISRYAAILWPQVNHADGVSAYRLVEGQGYTPSPFRLRRLVRLPSM